MTVTQKYTFVRFKSQPSKQKIYSINGLYDLVNNVVKQTINLIAFAKKRNKNVGATPEHNL